MLARLYVSLSLSLVTAAFVAFLLSSEASGQAPDPSKKVDPEINRPFQKPDVATFRKRFETESREVYARRNDIIDALDLKPGMRVADLGAGTGLFTRLIAAQVGPEGRVYAVDIAQEFLDHIKAESAKLGQKNVIPVLGSQTSTNLEPGSVDLVFVCDVYHHLEKPDLVLASVHRVLRPGGRLVVIEFDRHENSSEFVRKHIRASKAEFAQEIRDAGFVQEPLSKVPGFKENFMLRFRKAESPRNP